MLQVELGLWKADIDSAFRRVPIAEGHREFAAVVFLKDGTPFVSTHNALPFGSIASVHGWDRIGSLLRTLARKLLKLPVSRYVDDYFAADRMSSIEHAMSCFARCVLLSNVRTTVAHTILLSLTGSSEPAWAARP